MDHGVVQRWLRQVLGPYDDADRVYTDVDRTLISISSLSPKTEVYTYDDGRTQLLLVLMGTIPIQFRTASYNIPMSVWIPRAYPREPPMAYVTPTSDMLVRKGRFVDLSGRVEADYVQRWRRKWEGCSLIDLLHECQTVFGQEPPVYAKPKGVQPPPQQQQPSSSLSQPPSAAASSTDLRHRPAPQLHQPGAQNDAAASPSPSERLPLRPPKPGQSSNSFHDGEADRRASYGSSYAGQQSPIAGSPSQLQWSYKRSSGAPIPGPHAVDPRRSASLTLDRGPPPLLPRTPLAAQNRQATLPLSPSPHQQDRNANHYQPSPSPLHPQWQQTDPQAGPPLPQQPPQAQPPQQVQSPLPAPPRPPNPELLHMNASLHAKIHARLHHIRTTTNESNAQLQLLNDDLDRGELAVKDEMARLEAVRDVCQTTGDELQRAIDAAVRRVDELRSREEPDVDGLLSATSLVGNQLIDLVAEDNSIEDTLYHLGRALNAEIIDLDRFLKQSRFLAREQFMRRALALKISQSMNWKMD